MSNKFKLLFLLFFYSLSSFAGEGFTLSGKLETSKNDTMVMTAWPYLLSNRKMAVLPQFKCIAILHNGMFQFKVDQMDGPFYFLLDTYQNGRRRSMLNFFIAEPGDSIHIESANGQLSFSGNRAGKYQYQYAAAQGFSELARKFAVYIVRDSSHYLAHLQGTATDGLNMLEVQLEELYKWKDKIAPGIFNALRYDLIGRTGTILYATYQSAVKSDLKNYFTIPKMLEEKSRQVQDLFNKVLQNKLFTEEAIPESMVPKEYISFLLARESFCDNDCPVDTISQKVMRLKTGVYRDQIITLYLLNRYEFLSNAKELIDRALASVHNKPSKTILADIQFTLSGKPSSDFGLQDTKKNTRYLSEFINKVVVLDFWFTGCSGCVDFYNKTLRPLEEVYNDTSKFVFISISLDKEYEIWNKSLQNNLYTGKGALNLYTNGKGSDDPIIAHYKITGCPTFVVIDKKGITRLISAKQDKYNILATLIESLDTP